MSSQDETQSLLQRIWRSITEPFKQVHQQNQDIERVHEEYIRYLHALKAAPAPNSLYFILIVCPESEIADRIEFVHLLERITILSDPTYRPFISEERIARIMSIRAEMPALTGPHGELTIEWLERAKAALDEIVAMQ